MALPTNFSQESLARGLYKACQAGNVEVASKLLDLGVDPNFVYPPYEQTALRVAIEQGHPHHAMVKLLVERGATVTEMDFATACSVPSLFWLLLPTVQRTSQIPNQSTP